MTCVTGETGAGKSIMLDALGLCIGDRADARAVRAGADRAEISALFSVEHLPLAQAWLERAALLEGTVSHSTNGDLGWSLTSVYQWLQHSHSAPSWVSYWSYSQPARTSPASSRMARASR